MLSSSFLISLPVLQNNQVSTVNKIHDLNVNANELMEKKEREGKLIRACDLMIYIDTIRKMGLRNVEQIQNVVNHRRLINII